jgi:hypothetical protein
VSSTSNGKPENLPDDSESPTGQSRLAKLVEFYQGLSPAAQRALWVLLAVEVVLITAAQRDIQRRPADEIRGPKLLWRLIATQNVVGPAVYFGFGRRSR